MICTYCRGQNGPDDHRCSRCGRRLNDDSSRRNFPVQTSAAAPEIDFSPVTHDAPAPEIAPPPRPQLVTAPPKPVTGMPGNPTIQASLFSVQEVPRTMTPRPARPAAPMSPAPSARRKAVREQARQQARDQQPSLFDATADGLRALPTSVAARVYCEAEIAPTPARVFAATVDTGIPLLGFALFMMGFRYMTGSFELTMKTAPWFGAVAVLLFLLYRSVFCVAGIDTPGVQYAGLRLLDFDGRRPDRRTRAFRIMGGFISLVSVGIGLLWALLDEEHLTWHDHMSGTFPAIR